MASPPFSLTTTAPGDTDLASVFPSLDRGDKDVIQSWLLVLHNVYGRLQQAALDGVGTTYGLVSNPSPAAGTSTIFRGSAGVIEVIDGETSTIQTLGVPPGTILDYAGGSLPNGYLLCSGQAVSRSTYSNLFSIISTVWGTGDGSTTFNLPDLRGRSTFGLDNMGGTAAGRITLANGNYDGTVFANAGGLEANTVNQTNLPNVNLVSSSLTVTTKLANNLNPLTNTSGGFTIAAGSGGVSFFVASALQSTISGTVPLGGSGTVLPGMPPSAIVNKIIKY